MGYEKEEEEEGGLHRRSIHSVETEHSTWLVATMAAVIIHYKRDPESRIA